jgi:hypothetical protein
MKQFINGFGSVKNHIEGKIAQTRNYIYNSNTIPGVKSEDPGRIKGVIYLVEY